MSIDEKPKESVGRSYYVEPSEVYLEITRWKSNKGAETDYNKATGSVFDVDKYMGPWNTPDDLYVSTAADNYQAACGIDHKVIPQCRMLATYDEYSVYFRADIFPDGITVEKVNQLLKAIDDRMAECLE